MPSDFERKWCGPLDYLTDCSGCLYCLCANRTHHMDINTKHKTLGPELIHGLRHMELNMLFRVSSLLQWVSKAIIMANNAG